MATPITDGQANIYPTRALTVNIYRDISTSRQSVQYASGLKLAKFQYKLLPGATAVANQFMKIVVNAASDADATGKLATDGAFIPLCQGDSIELIATDSNPITRVDFLTEQAVAAEKTIFYILGGI